MAERYKAVFLPIDERILTLYKGYTLNGKMLSDLKREDVYKETTYYVIDEKKSKIEQISRFVILIPLVPLLILVAIIAALFKKFDSFAKKSSHIINSFFGFFFKMEKTL